MINYSCDQQKHITTHVKRHSSGHGTNVDRKSRSS